MLVSMEIKLYAIQGINTIAERDFNGNGNCLKLRGKWWK